MFLPFSRPALYRAGPSFRAPWGVACSYRAMGHSQVVGTWKRSFGFRDEQGRPGRARDLGRKAQQGAEVVRTPSYPRAASPRLSSLEHCIMLSPYRSHWEAMLRPREDWRMSGLQTSTLQRGANPGTEVLGNSGRWD